MNQLNRPNPVATFVANVFGFAVMLAVGFGLLRLAEAVLALF